MKQNKCTNHTKSRNKYDTINISSRQDISSYNTLKLYIITWRMKALSIIGVNPFLRLRGLRLLI